MIKFEIQKKKFQQILKTHSEHAGFDGILSNILISVKGNLLSFYSSDGNRLLRTKLMLSEEHKT